jgi:hypothetical protein
MARLKGNYKLPKNSSEKEKKDETESSTQEFERRALEKLGGSIAFVQKKDVFVWNGDKSPTEQKK